MACDLFTRASAYGGRAGKFLPILQRLQQKAHQIYLDSHNGMPPPMRNDIFSPSPKDEDQDELSIFSGKTRTIVKKTTPPACASRSSKSASPPVEPSPRNFTAIPAFAGVHPSLVDQLRGFDGHLTAQIQNAYHVNHDDFALSLMGNRPQGSQRHHHTRSPRQDQIHHSQNQNTHQAYQQHQMNPAHMYNYTSTHNVMRTSPSSSSSPIQGPGYDSQSVYWPDPVQVNQYSNSPQQQPMHYYPPDGAPGGPADDIGLQETWASFMYQVGSPRPFIDN